MGSKLDIFLIFLMRRYTSTRETPNIFSSTKNFRFFKKKKRRKPKNFWTFWKRAKKNMFLQNCTSDENFARNRFSDEYVAKNWFSDENFVQDNFFVCSL